MTEEIITLNEGDTITLDYPTLTINRATPPPPPPSSVKFAWITDPHAGRSSTYNPGELQAIIAHILAENPNFTIVTGDCTEDGSEQQMLDYLSCWPQGVAKWELPGNHDEWPLKYDDPPPNQYPWYVALINQFRWSFSHGGYRFIGFTTHLKRDDPYRGSGYVAQIDRDHVQANLSSSEINMLFTHFPYDDSLGNNVNDWWNWDGGQQWLYGLGSQYNIKLFTGHRHLSGLNVRVGNNITEVNGGCLAYDLGNVSGSYQIVTAENGVLTVNRYLGRAPFTLLETVTL